jgi:hypothetical protein
MAEPVTVESNIKAPPLDEHDTAERDRARARATALWRSISHALRKPAIGAGVAGATVLAAGAIWGVTEAALAGVAAWAVFRTLKKRAAKKAKDEVAPAST